MIGISKCGHCNGSETKIVEIEPRGAHYKQIAICCSACSAILSTTGYYDTGSLIKTQEKKIDALVQQVGDLTRTVHSLSREVQELRRGRN